MKIQIKGACYKLPKRFFFFLKDWSSFPAVLQSETREFSHVLKGNKVKYKSQSRTYPFKLSTESQFRNRNKIPNFILKNTAKQEVPWERTIVWMIKLTRFHLKWTQNYIPHLRIQWLCCLRLIRCINKIES